MALDVEGIKPVVAFERLAACASNRDKNQDLLIWFAGME